MTVLPVIRTGKEDLGLGLPRDQVIGCYEVGLRTVPYTYSCTVPYYGHGTRTIKHLCIVLMVQ